MEQTGMFTLSILLFAAASANAADSTRKNEPALEQPPADPKAVKIVLVAGSNFYKAGEHEYIANCAVLADLLKQNPGVAPVLAVDWPKKPGTFEGARAVVFLFDGADKHQLLKENRLPAFQKLLEAKVGLVQLHQTADYPKDFSEKAIAWAGGAWEKGKGARAHWVQEFNSFSKHAIVNGVKPFKLDDGWLYKNTFAAEMKGITPLLRTWNPKATDKPTCAQDVIAWVYERSDGGRSFTFTGGHLHASFAEAGYRRFLVNGILWSAGVEVPVTGAKADLDGTELPKYLTPPPAPTKK